MDTNRRFSGLDGLGDMAWGTHFCFFYETREDLLDILIPYLKAGLENQECCVYVASPSLDAEAMQKAMRAAVPMFERYVTTGQIQIISYADWYLEDEDFDARKTIQGALAAVKQAQALGYTGLRFATNTFWLEKHHWTHFAEYEGEMNGLVRSLRAIGLCAYALPLCSAADVLDVVQHHQFTVVRRMGKWEYLESPELTHAREEVLKLNTELEQRVAERTAELATANEALKENRERFQIALQAAQIGTGEWDIQADQSSVSNGLERVFGFAPGTFHPNFAEFIELVYPEDREPFRRRLEEAIAGKTDYDMDYRIVWPDGSIHWISSWGRIFYDDGGTPTRLVGAAMDITERKRAEEELHRYAARMKALTETSRIFFEAGLNYHDVLHIIARRTAELIGDSCVITLFSDDGQRSFPVAFHHTQQNALDLMQISLLQSWQGGTDTERFHTLLTGKPIYVPQVDPEEFRAQSEPEFWPYLDAIGVSSALIVPLQTQGRVIGTLGITRDRESPAYTRDDQLLLQDIADRAALTIQNARLFEQAQASQERLQVLSHRLVEVQESERKRLAREIHDDISQRLTALMMQLGTAKSLLPKSAKSAHTILEQTEELIEKTLERTRSIIADLRPQVLDDLGLIPALRRLGDELQKSTGAAVRIKTFRMPKRLPAPTEVALFRIVQEALANVRKHAGARHVKISLAKESERVVLSVQDDGVGFEMQTARSRRSGDMIIDGGWVIPAGHFGLIGIQERAVHLGGTFQVRSAPGEGTTIQVELPLT